MAGSLDGGRAGTRATTKTRATAPVVAQPALRLTRRGRAVLIAFAASVLLVVFWLTAGPGARAGGGDDPAPADGWPPQTVVVGPGETIWDIAERNDPDGDPRVSVQRIADLNGLSDSIVHPGQRLLVPSP